MAIRKIIKIDEDKCDGCGLCIIDCAEGALAIVDGKARLVKESHCDGLGACLGSCPQGAITIEEREADAFDKQAAAAHQAQTKRPAVLPTLPCGCPGTAVWQLKPAAVSDSAPSRAASQLSHWPVQLALVPPGAPFLQGADLLLAADCVPFALADFHSRFLRNHAVVVGCPKLDDPQRYVEKLADILRQSSIHSLTILHMEVPCCAGLCTIARRAMEAAGLKVPTREVTVAVNGRAAVEEDWSPTTQMTAPLHR